MKPYRRALFYTVAASTVISALLWSAMEPPPWLILLAMLLPVSVVIGAQMDKASGAEQRRLVRRGAVSSGRKRKDADSSPSPLEESAAGRQAD